MKKFITILLIAILLFSTNAYAIDETELFEYIGKNVEIGVLIDLKIIPLKVKLLNVLNGLEIFHGHFISSYYIVAKFNSGKPFLFPCKYITYVEEIK